MIGEFLHDLEVPGGIQGFESLGTEQEMRNAVQGVAMEQHLGEIPLELEVSNNDNARIQGIIRKRQHYASPQHISPETPSLVPE